MLVLNGLYPNRRVVYGVLDTQVNFNPGDFSQLKEPGSFSGPGLSLLASDLDWSD